MSVIMHELPPPQAVRHEVKILAEPADLPDAVAWLLGHRMGFRPRYADRTVNNVYFDTPLLAAFSANQSGISERAKVRLRWYGQTWQPLKNTLEIKARGAAVGWKWSQHVNAPLDLTTQTWQQIRQAVRDRLAEHLAIPLDLRPVVSLINRYDRMYFESQDSRVRVTLDRSVQLFPQLGRATPGIWHAANNRKALIIEMKVAQEDRGLAALALVGLPWRVTRHSKYVAGIESLLSR